MKTKQEGLGQIFGDTLQAFDPTGRPTMNDITRVYIFKYDEKRGNKNKISDNDKDMIMNEIVDALINVWTNIARPVALKKDVKKMVKSIILEAEKLEKSMDYYKDRPEWIDAQRDRFKKIADLSPPTPRKPKERPEPTEKISTPLGKRDKKSARKRLIEEIEGKPKAQKKLDEVEPEIQIDELNISSDEIDDIEMNDEVTNDPDYVWDDCDDDEYFEEEYDTTSETTNNMHDFSEVIKYGISHRLSIRVITGMYNSSVRCVWVIMGKGTPPENMLLTTSKVRREIIRMGVEIRKIHNESISNLTWIGVDGRTDKVALPNGKFKKIENVSIIDSLTGKYVDQINPEDHSARELAKAIYENMLKFNSTKSLEGVNLDNCPTNTGAKEAEKGAMYYLEHKYLKRPLMRVAGMLHTNELLLRHLMLKICGFETSGPYSFKDFVGILLKNLKNDLRPVADFDPIETNLPYDIPAKLLQSNDQRYLYNILMAINKGPTDALFEDEKFMNKNPGEIAHARWLTQLNNSGRLYTQMTEPEEGGVNEMGLNLEQFNNLKRVVTFGTQAYAPSFMNIKKYPDLKNASEHFLNMIKLSKKVCTDEEFEILKEVFANNSHTAHPETILYWAIRGLEYRKKAVDLILKIRQKKRKKNFVRKYQRPKIHHINFDAETPWELVDFETLPENFLSEPVLTKKFTNEELIAYANGEMDLTFPFIKCHNGSLALLLFFEKC